MSDAPLVYAVVLAWNHIQDTLECVESLLQSHYPNLKVLVVDNGSTDGTHEILRQRFPQVDVLRLEENAGSTRGYNHGIQYALQHQADYVMTMNNDTVVAPEMVSRLVAGIRQHPQAGMVVPKIYHYYTDEPRIWCVGARWRPFPPRIKLIGADAPDGPAFQRPAPLPYATSCCILMSREALSKVEGFDTRYYFYYEDWDLSARFWKAGYEIWFIPEATMWHKVSITTQKAERPQRWWYDMGRSSVRFYLSHFSPAVLGWYTLWFLLRETFKGKVRARVLPYLCGLGEGIAQWKGWRP